MSMKMNPLFLLIRHPVALGTAALLIVVLSGAAQRYSDARGAVEQAHRMVSADAIKWTPASPGISSAVLSGSPGAEGSAFVLRLKMDDNVKVPPHWHPTDEHLTVLSGTFHMGVGETFDEGAASAMTVGAYAVMPKEVRHFAWATGETVIQIHGVGPFKTFFVDQTSK
jgi:quercetin dioxygenase-like cupin family protein